MKKLILLLSTVLVLVAGVRAVRTANDGPAVSVVAGAPKVAIRDGAAERLAGAVRIRTISSEDGVLASAEFRALHAYLATAFPRVHAQLGREVVAEHSLLYTWPGRDPALKPLLITGHMDVVPIEPDTKQAWTQDPFGGRIVDGFIWGRGAIDNKSTVVGALEAVEMLLAEGVQPMRTVHLAFGHDEEVGGMRGAREIAALLEARGVQLEMVLDEGGVIADGVLAGVSQPVALVGIAEKGFMTIELSARTTGGHSSLPPAWTAIGIVSAAVARLEASQMPARLEGPTEQMLDHVRSAFPLLQRSVFANLWLTRPYVVRRLQQDPATNAMVRTTTAPTILQAGTKDNVLPSSARAAVNFRILPGDTMATVREHVRRVVSDERVQLRIVGRFSAEPSAISSTESASFQMLERTIRAVVPDAIVAPSLVVVVTDARHYAELTPDVFRFLPLRMSARDLSRMHGVDERIGVAEYETAIRTYRELVVAAAQ